MRLKKIILCTIFSIKIYDKKIKLAKRKFPYCLGEIGIGDFREIFEISLLDWKIDDYENQWKEELERIKYKDNSCLIASINFYKNNPFIDWWILYRQNKKIFIQNEWLFGEEYEKRVGAKNFNAQTCYQFIPSRETVTAEGNDISEWVIELS